MGTYTHMCVCAHRQATGPEQMVVHGVVSTQPLQNARAHSYATVTKGLER